MNVFDITNIHSPDSQPEQKPLVLLVDDEVKNLEVLSMLLEDEFDLLNASNGTEAVEILQKIKNQRKNEKDSQTVQLVISDQRMDNMSGLELFEKTSQIIPDTPFILISGTRKIQQMDDLTNQIGLFALITKPIDPQAFLHKAHQGIDAYQQRQQILTHCGELEMDIQVISEQLAEKKRSLELARQKLSGPAKTVIDN